MNPAHVAMLWVSETNRRVNAMPPTLQIKLLGDFSLSSNHQSVTGISSERSQILLAYLLLYRHTPQPRQRLAFHFWADSTDAQARANLRKELSYLRRALPEPDAFLLVDAKTLQWQPNAPFTLDVADFEQAIKAAAQAAAPEAIRSTLEQAVELYQGDLLPNCDDEWILPERERLQQMRVRGLAQLIDVLEEQQDYRAALNYAQQLLRVDSLNEATYCSLIRLYALSGDRANALQIYHRCMTVLREELGVDPSPMTRKLYEQVLNEDEAPIDRPPVKSQRWVLRQSKLAALPLVGREREWALIQQWLGSGISPIAQELTSTAAHASHPAVTWMTDDDASEVLLLLGEAGIGKTRLLEELREKMHLLNGYVLWGRGFAAEMVRPYGVWIDALRSLAAEAAVSIPQELGFLLPEAGQAAETPADRSRLFDAVVQFLAQLCQSAVPVAILLDDIQWIDEASCALLHYAARVLSHLPIRFACAARPQELEAYTAVLRVVQALRREGRLRTIELSPLEPEQTAQLVRSLNLPQSPKFSWDQIAAQVFIESGGNPLFALEIARALSQRATVHSETLEALIQDRLQQLGEHAHELLPWAAALGRSFKPTTVADVADFPLAKLLVAIEQLEQQAIIRPGTAGSDEIRYDFIHDIVRQVAYRQLSEPRRRLVHLQIAHKLNQLSKVDAASHAGDIAHHAALGGDRVLAATASLTAAERCLKLFAYAEAAELSQRGIEHCQSLSEQPRIQTHLSLLRVCAIAGVSADQAAQVEVDVQRLVEQANARGWKDEAMIGLEALVVLHFNRHDFVRVHQDSLRVAEASRAASPVTAARMLAYGGSCLAEIGRDMLRAEALLLEAQSLADRVGLLIVDIPCGLGSVQRHNGHYAEARTLLQQAWRLAQTEQDHWRECSCLCYLAMTELEAGNPAAALPYCREMAEVATKMSGESSEGAFAVALEALSNYAQRKPDAAPALEQAILTLQQIDAKRMLSYLLVGAATSDLKTDQAELALYRAKTALEAAQAVNHPSEIALAWAILIQSTLTLGNWQQAKAWFEAAHPQIDRHSLSMLARIAVDRITQLVQTGSLSSCH